MLPIVFKQIRIGYRDKPFIIYKIRTMDKDGEVTKLGSFLRKTAIDELPQILNLIKGDLVLVGPRPLTPQDHRKFRNFTLPIKPGLTGWWQIHGRQQETIWWYDMEYLKRKSFWLDVCIIIRTIPLVLLARHG